MSNFWEDLSYGLRALRAKPAFAATAILTLAMGIAASTVVFSWIDLVLLQPVTGTSDGNRLVIFETVEPNREGFNVSYADFRDYRDHLSLSTPAITLLNNSFSLGEGEHAQRVWAELVSGNYFSVLGVRPLLGRFFSPEEQGDKPGAYPVAVISERLWRTYFHADPNVLQTQVRVNQHELTIIGIAPADFYGAMRGLNYEMWAPIMMGPELNRFNEQMLNDRRPRMFNAVARLKPGVTLQQARSELAAVASSLAAKYPKTNDGFSATLYPEAEAHNSVRSFLRGPLRILMAMALVVLLIACVNVANLLLARSAARQNELSIRLALGASRLRIGKQLLTEAFLLATLGTIAGIPLSMWMANSIAYLAPVAIGFPFRMEPPALNAKIFAFTILICLASALLSGLSPALSATRLDLNQSLKEEGRSGTSGVRSNRLRALFVVSEVALALVALIGAGLFVANFQIARTIAPGFDPQHILVSGFYTSMSGYTGEQRAQFCVRLRESLQQSPGISGVTYADTIPLGFGRGPGMTVQVEGYVPAQSEEMTVGRTLVSPGYFGVLRMPLLDGRDFTEQDDAKTAPVAIVNQAFAQRYFGGRNPVGRKFQARGKWTTIVGLVKVSKYYSLTEAPRPYFYLPVRQAGAPEDIAFFIRTSGDSLDALVTLRRVAAAVDPNAGAFDAMPFADYIGAPLFAHRFAASLLTALGAMSLLLAAVGLYSVMAYVVSQRIHEIGIRVMLGAQPNQVLAMVVRRGLSLAAAGVLAGIMAALALSRLVSSMLANVNAADPLIFAVAAVFLVVVAMLASYLPARRASSIDPMSALRHQ